MLALAFLLSSFGNIIAAQQLNVGDACNLAQAGNDEKSSGRCELLADCESIYHGLLAGISPEKLCGFSHEYDAIVCCPAANLTSSTHYDSPEETTTTQLIPSSTMDIGSRNKPGDLSRRKCAEYARSVYALVQPPILPLVGRPVNVSLCAIKSKKLIVGGRRADPKEFPHMAAVGFIDTSLYPKVVWICGGTLVSDTYVLTAAHCTYSIQYGNAALVRVGDLDLTIEGEDAAPQERRIIKRIRHPDYRKPSEYHDVALLRLESPIVFDAYTRPACLPISRSFGSYEVIATGWGRVNWMDEDGSSHLLKVTLPTVSQERCNASYHDGNDVDYKLDRGIVDDWQICAGQEGRDTCQGDSGGPIVVYDPDNECMYDVIGITSLGRWCGSSVPGIYTRVYNYIGWLENSIWPSD